MEIPDSMTEQTPAQIERASLLERIATAKAALDRAKRDCSSIDSDLEQLDADILGGGLDEGKVNALIKIRSRRLTNAELRAKEAAGELRALQEDLRRVEAIPGVVKPEDLFGAVYKGVVGASVTERLRAAQLHGMMTVPGASEEDCKLGDW